MIIKNVFFFTIPEAASPDPTGEMMYYLREDTQSIGGLLTSKKGNKTDEEVRTQMFHSMSRMIALYQA